MPILTATQNHTLATGGGTLNLDVNLPFTHYTITMSGTYSSNWTIQPTGTAAAGMLFIIEFNGMAGANLGGNSVTLFGEDISADKLNSIGRFYCRYDGSSWDVSFMASSMKTSQVKDIKRVEKTIQAAQLDALFTTPQTLITSRKTSETINIVQAYAYLTGANTHTTNTDIELGPGSANDSQFRFKDILGQSGSGYLAEPVPIPSGGTGQLVAGQDIVAYVNTANPTGGASTAIKFIVYYTVE